MIDSDKVIRDIYTSDIILMEEEIEMMYGVDDSYFNQLTILDKGIIIKQLKIQGQPTQKRRHWRQRAAFLRGG